MVKPFVLNENMFSLKHVQIIKHARGSWAPSDPEPTFSEVERHILQTLELPFKMSNCPVCAVADRGGPGKVGRALDAGQPQMQAKLSYLELFKLVHQGLPTAFPICHKVRELG